MKICKGRPFGARILKTGLAVALALYICSLLKLEPSIFAAVSAVMNIQPSIYRSFRNALDQVFIHIISVIIAVICGYLLGSNPIIMGLATILIITTNVKLNMKQGLSMGIVAGIFVLGAPQHDFFNHALTRSYVIFVGLGAALVVNNLLPQPRYKDSLLTHLGNFNKQTASFFEQLMRGFITLQPMDNEEFKIRRDEIKDLLRTTRNLFELHREQNRYLNMVPLEVEERWEKYLDLNVKLFYKSQEIYSAIQQRLQWRAERGDPPISSEFTLVLKMLERGIGSFKRLNHDLYLYVIEGQEPKPIPISDEFWEELSIFIDKWHTRMTGAAFLHAFMYVTVIANDIKWATRSIKEFTLPEEKVFVEQRKAAS
ncbi:aromatic acid exporter family protein [Desulfotomaculum defluvii]